MSDRVIGGLQEAFEFIRGLEASFRAIRLRTEVIYSFKGRSRPRGHLIQELGLYSYQPSAEGNRERAKGFQCIKKTIEIL